MFNSDLKSNPKDRNLELNLTVIKMIKTLGKYPLINTLVQFDFHVTCVLYSNKILLYGNFFLHVLSELHDSICIMRQIYMTDFLKIQPF